jgi:hypothetical protein
MFPLKSLRGGGSHKHTGGDDDGRHRGVGEVFTSVTRVGIPTGMLAGSITPER